VCEVLSQASGIKSRGFAASDSPLDPPDCFKCSALDPVKTVAE
jgi:hypothetical protein